MFGNVLTLSLQHTDTQPVIDTQRQRIAPKALKAANKSRSVDNFSRWLHLTSICNKVKWKKGFKLDAYLLSTNTTQLLNVVKWKLLKRDVLLLVDCARFGD